LPNAGNLHRRLIVFESGQLLNHPVVIVGASMGGLRAAEALRRFGYLGPITAIGDEPHAPYNRPPLSKEVLANEVSHEAVAFLQRTSTEDVNWVLGTRVASADLEHKTVTDANGNVHPYRALIIATGLRPRRLQVSNGDLSGRHVVRTLDDAIALRAELVPGARVVVIGAGFIGCEVAATARKLGCEVTVVSPATHPIIRPLGVQLAEEIQRRHEAMGVKFLLKRNVVDLVSEDRVGAGRVSGVALDDGTVVPADLVVEAIGSLPNTEWLEGNDLDLSAGVLTDGSLRALKADGSAWPSVFAIGDVARFPNPIFGPEPRRVEHWNIPTDSAKRVAQVLAAEIQIEDAHDADSVAAAQTALNAVLVEDFSPIPSFWSDQYDMHILSFGLCGLADRAVLAHGEISGDCVFEYYKGTDLVGVCGIGMRSVVQSYRAKVGIHKA
jgi:3-phenylpropionate/trans-cinnamate dioxygenase ferredoxin reductase subunit